MTFSERLSNVIAALEASAVPGTQEIAHNLKRWLHDEAYPPEAKTPAAMTAWQALTRAKLKTVEGVEQLLSGRSALTEIQAATEEMATAQAIVEGLRPKKDVN